MKKHTAITLGFILSLVFLATTHYLSNSFFTEFTKKDREEAFVYNLAVQLDDLLRSLKDERHAQRLCLISKSPEDLEAYRNAVAKVDSRITGLQHLSLKRPRYYDRLGKIVVLVHKRHDLLEGGLEKGVRDPGTKELIREIRNQARDLKNVALADLLQFSAVQQKNLSTLKLIMLAKTLAVAILFSTVFLLLRKDIAHRARQQAVLIAHRDHLDELVLLRTQELQQANQQLQNEMEVRKQAERALHNLNQHTEQIREKERLTIARDIHDDIGQSLTALKLDLAWLEHRFNPGNAEFSGRLSNMKAFLDRLIKKAQNLISELRPPLLDSLGLSEAVEWQVREFRRRTGISCELSLEGNFKEVRQDVATAVVRILMEALTNVSRHAEATAVRVALRSEQRFIVLDVTDNGRGLTSEHVQSPDSFGLMGMRERALLCNGELSLSGLPQTGTAVRLRVPLAESEET